MGYAVYWANGRWQGYGVPAYCDYPGCKKKIDRGLGYTRNDDNQNEIPIVFCCSDHEFVEGFEIEEKEHPEWLNHVLNHESWEQWRTENPKMLIKYKFMLGETK